MESNIVYKNMKPYVCICDFEVVVKPKKWMHRITHEKIAVRKEAVEKYVYSFKLENYPITLDENGKFPTENTKNRVLKSIWMYSRKKGKYEDVNLELININIKHKSKVSYDFDYSKD